MFRRGHPVLNGSHICRNFVKFIEKSHDRPIKVRELPKRLYNFHDR